MFVDNRDVEEQERRGSRASSPYSSISSGNHTFKSNGAAVGGGGGHHNKSIVIIANPSPSSPPHHHHGLTEASDLYDVRGDAASPSSTTPSRYVNLSKATNFAELSKLRESLGSSAINIVYMQQDKDPSVAPTSAGKIQQQSSTYVRALLRLLS